MKNVETGKTSKEDFKYIKKGIKDFPKEYQNKILDESNLDFSIITEYIIRDIGMYLGDVFRKTSSKIHWTYYNKPKTDIYVNRPVLKGFIDNTMEIIYEPSFEPINMVRTQASRIIDGEENEKDLLKIYNTWLKYIE